MGVKATPHDREVDSLTVAALKRLIDLIRHNKETIRSLPSSEVDGWLYANWYVVPEVAQPLSHDPLGAPPLAAGLRAALEAAEYWTRGWVVLEVGAGQSCLIGKGLLRRLVRPGEFANMARWGAPAAPGDEVAAFKFLTWVDPPTGFFVVQTDQCDANDVVVRLYVSVSAEQIGNVLPLLVRDFDDLAITWSLKCPSNREGFSRVDSLVVYVKKEDWPTLESHLTQRVDVFRPLLRSSIPPLSKPVMVGMGFAEDPSDKQSFGQSRCKALCKAVQAIAQQERIMTNSALRALLASLDEQGIDPEHPWRNPMSSPAEQRSGGGGHGHG